jgi:phospholipase C
MATKPPLATAKTGLHNPNKASSEEVSEMADKPTRDNLMPETSRRSLIKGAAITAGAALTSLSQSSAEAASSLPDPSATGIDHIVLLMQENRSFDHMLGWVPGANGVQAGRTFVDTMGSTQSSHLLTLFQNCSSADPDHSWQGGRTQLADGAMNGFLQTAKAGDTFPIGYYSATDLPFFAAAARYWTICDSYHCGILGPTYPNRFYMHAGQTDRISNTASVSTLPTIWDSAAAAGVSARYYYSDAAYTALWGSKYASISKPFSQFQADAAAGNLPSISYVDPRFAGEGAGTSTDDHPLADVRNGQVLMNEVYTTLSTSPSWAKTLLIINYDEWGGFADHVAPQMAPVSAAEVAAGNVDVHNADGTGMAYLGFRTPLLLIGPRARRGSVSHSAYDPNAILNFMCWRFGLAPVGVRATTSGNIATALNFSGAPDLSLPPAVDLLPFNPNGPTYGSSCTTNPMANIEEIYKTFGQHYADLDGLKRLMLESGFQRA